MINSTSTIRVRYSETDKLGIVHHSNFFVWFDEARVQLLEDLNLPYPSLERQGYHLPVIETQVHFLKSCTFGDELEIKTQISEVAGVRFKISYVVFCQKLEIAKGYTKHAFIDNDGRAVKPPQAFLAALR